MKILVLRGSPRKSGVTEKFAKLFIEGLKNSGVEFSDIDLCAKKINQCVGCYSCTKSMSYDACPIKDDTFEILKKFSEAEIIVCFSPVYFHSVSSQFKVFFDRCFPFIKGYIFDSDKKILRNDVCFEVKSKKLISFSVASGRRAEAFDSIVKMYSDICVAMGIEYCIPICRGESQLFVENNENSLRVSKILKNTVEAGRQLGISGKIPEELIKNIELELTPSDSVFAERAKVYWTLKSKNR